jgi:hypothetical protein
LNTISANAVLNIFNFFIFFYSERRAIPRANNYLCVDKRLIAMFP